jgi:hypothetical protein
VLGRAGTAMTAREIADALVADKTLKQPGNRLSTCRRLSLRHCESGTGVIGEGAPARWP